MGVQAAERHARRARLPQLAEQRPAGASAVRPRVHEQVTQHGRRARAVPDPPGRAEPGNSAIELGDHHPAVRQ